MKRFFKVEPICPFVGKPCIREGMQWNSDVIRPCVFWDGDKTINHGIIPEPPCRIERALKKILANEKLDEVDWNNTVCVPWDTDTKE